MCNRFRNDGNVTYYLPKGEWTRLLSNEVKQGGSWMQGNYDYFSLPLFVRENTLLPIGKVRTNPEYNYTDGLTVHIFALKDKAETVIYDTNGEFALKAAAVNENGHVTVTLDGAYTDLKLCMRNLGCVKNATGASLEESDLGAVLSVTDHTVSFDLA